MSGLSRRSFLLTSSCAACATLASPPTIAQQKSKGKSAGGPTAGSTKVVSPPVSRGTRTRCGTRDPATAAVRESVRLANRAKESMNEHRDIEVPVNFHVLHDGKDGYVSEDRLRRQIEVLNADFRDCKVAFHINNIDWHDNPDWHRMVPAEIAAAYGYADNEGEAKQALGRDTDQTLNAYIVAPSIGGLLGWATFPWDLEIKSEMDGIVLNHAVVPGDPDFPQYLGRTGTHEVGHWLGLLHTFQNGCSEPGDGIDDTPFQAEEVYDCPVPAKSCPNSFGVDPVANFMNYTNDSCMNAFTVGQIGRIQSLTQVFRPRLLRETAAVARMPVASQPAPTAPAPASLPSPASARDPSVASDAVNTIIHGRSR